MRHLSLALIITALVATTAISADAKIGDRIRERMAARFEKQIAKDSITGGRDIAYGADPLQHLSFWEPATRANAPAPLVVFVHGGGWKRGDIANATGKAKLAHYPAQGYAFASVNYRLVPDATVEQQAADVASAVGWIVSHARELNVDPRRIVLMGHSAGAHLVALVGTDPAYLRAVGLSQDALAGIVPIDGAAYDVPKQLEIGAPLMGKTYLQAFGSDPARQKALSPTLQAASPNAPAFLIIHVQRRDGAEQSRGLAAALKASGAAVQINDFPGTGLQGHMDINRKLGLADYPATPVVDSWIKARFAG